MGPGGRGGNVKEKVNKGAAWTAQALAVAAGAAVLTTFVGQWVAVGFGLLPSWLKAILLVAAVLWALGDWWKDGVPNKQALYIGVAAPALAAGLDGSLAANVRSGSDRLLGAVDGTLTGLLGELGAIGVAGVLLVSAFIIARHTVQAR
jgi:hypothetical protein